MWVPLNRSVYRRNLAKHDLIFRFNSVSSLAQLPFSDVSDSGSDENCPFSHNNSSANSLNHARQVFDKYPHNYSSINSFNHAHHVLDKRTVTETFNHLIRKPKTALLFISHLKESGFKHDVTTYMAIIRFFCQWGMIERLEYMFLDVIEDKIGHFGFKVSNLFDELLEEINTDGDNLFIKAVDGLIKAFISVKHFDEVCGVLLKIQGRFLPSVHTCNLFINRLVEEGEVDMAITVYEHLKINNFSPNVYTYGIIIQGYCKKGIILKAIEIHDEMCSLGINTNCVIMSSIMQCLSRLGMLSESVYQFINAMESGIFLDKISFNIAIDALCKLGKMTEAVFLLNEMTCHQMKPDIKHYTTLINGYCLNKDTENALKIFNQINENGLKPDIITFNVLMSGLSKCGLVDETMARLNNMVKLGLEPTSVTYNIIIEGLCNSGKVIEAGLFFNKIKIKRLSNYIAMMNGYCDSKYVEKAYELFYKLSDQEKNGIIMEKNCCGKILNGLCEKGETEKALMLFKIILISENGPCKLMCSKLKSAFCRAGNVRMARWVFDMMIARGIKADVISYTIMSHGYFRVNWLKEAYELFIDMIKNGIRPDIVTYTVLYDGESKVNRKRFIINRVNDRDRKDVSKYLTKMQDLVPDVVLYTVMIDNCCKLGNLEGAKCLFDEMIERGLEADTVAYTSLISGYSARGFLEAKMLYNEMISKGVPPDSRTIRALNMQF